MSITNNQGLSKSKDNKETERLVKEYLEKGGTIKTCKPDATTPDIGNAYGWGKRPSKTKDKDKE